VDKYEFKLLPAYSKFNKVVIKNQEGATISFMIPYYERQKLKTNLKKAFCNYLDFVRIQEDCPEVFKKKAVVKFIYSSEGELRKYYLKNMQKIL